MFNLTKLQKIKNVYFYLCAKIYQLNLVTIENQLLSKKKNHRYLLLFIIETQSLNYLLQLVLL